MLINFLKSILHNVGVLLVGFVVALLGRAVDTYIGIPEFGTELAYSLGIILLAAGFLIRVWAAYYFYQNQMHVIVLHPQKKLITTGPFRFSRNPLYLGGNVFIFFGAAIFVGTPMGIVITILQLYLVNKMIQREERQLSRTFAKQWTAYAKHVRRWI